jgi:hypothetical protein
MIDQPKTISGILAMRKDIKVDKLALRVDNMSASEVSSSSPIDHVSPRVVPSNVLDLIQSSKITPIQPETISTLFIDGHIEILNANYFTSSFLFIDLRPSSSFASSRVINSVNPGLPPLVQKRLKKKMFSNFSLLNFLLPSCQSRFNAWKVQEEKYLVVYDDTMDNYEGDAWSFLVALTEGLAKDMCPEKVPKLGFVFGGFSGLERLQDFKTFLYVEPSSPEGVALMDTSPSSNNSTPKIALRKGKMSLAIDIIAKKETPGKKPPLNLSIAPNSDQKGQSSPLSSASPNDNAAPTDDYSKITNYIFVGSDVLPLSPNGPQLLSELGVTHILNMAAEIKNSKVVEESGKFNIKWIPVLDNIEVDMDQALQDAITFIGMICLKS